MSVDEIACIVVFGSKVLPDGTASGSLRRRTLGALEFGNKLAVETRYIVSGGVGQHPPSEAEVMSGLLVEAGVARENIILDEDATDTFDSIVNAGRLTRQVGSSRTYLCSDDYHVPRCKWVYSILFGPCEGVYIHGSRSAVGKLRWLYYCIREMAATPWDIFLAIVSRFSTR